MPDINKLLEQCEQRTQVLSQESDRAANDVSQIVQFVTTLAAKLNTASDEAASSFEALNSKLEAAEQNLESELASAKEGLSGLQEKSSHLQSQTEEKINLIKSQFADVKSRKKEISSEVNEDSETTKASFEKLSQQAQEVETEAGNNLETSQSNLEEFQTAVDETTSSFNERKTTLLQHFGAFEEDFKNRLESLNGDFYRVEEESNNKLATVQSTLDTSSSDVLAAIAQKFIEEAVSELSDSADNMTKSVSVLAEAGEGSNDLLDEKLADVVDEIVDVFGFIKEIEPVLEQVQAVLG